MSSIATNQIFSGRTNKCASKKKMQKDQVIPYAVKTSGEKLDPPARQQKLPLKRVAKWIRNDPSAGCVGCVCVCVFAYPHDKKYQINNPLHSNRDKWFRWLCPELGFLLLLLLLFVPSSPMTYIHFARKG